MIHIFNNVCGQCSKVTTREYSTSFSKAIGLLHPDLRQDIHNIYGLVRFGDEIVDTFHEHDKQELLKEFRDETFKAIERGISLNPILHSFQLTLHKYRIDPELVNAFFRSMEQDLEKKSYDKNGYRAYIYGSAEVVGLMCLYVFCEGKRDIYESLQSYARSLGAAFQKVNFLRDLRADFTGLERMYFPGCDFHHFTRADKMKIEADIQKDFDAAYFGITHLPLKARLGTYVAYKYYYSLFKKIQKMDISYVKKRRVSIPNFHKAIIVAKAGMKRQLNLL